MVLIHNQLLVVEIHNNIVRVGTIYFITFQHNWEINWELLLTVLETLLNFTQR